MPYDFTDWTKRYDPAVVARIIKQGSQNLAEARAARIHDGGMRFLESAPILEPLIVRYPEPRIIVREAPPMILPTWGLTAADFDLGAAFQAEREAIEWEAAEAFAWSMFRDCLHCGKSFLPDRSTSKHCSRECYLTWYRRKEAARYAESTRRWRDKAECP